ncbi:MAG: hypothetical protein M1834_009123 [Cirrosporium novae-zelandiae]|nr:MAG: hypothetical protein M1834_009123 [Cirrosporium novae-zelandiae]
MEDQHDNEHIWGEELHTNVDAGISALAELERKESIRRYSLSREKSRGWSYERWLQEQEDKKSQLNLEKKQLTLTWRNVCVTGVDSTAILGDNFLSVINPVDIYRQRRGPTQEKVIVFEIHGVLQHKANGSNWQVILKRTSGQLKPGEMLLVLGRPGSGCTSFLKAMANKRSGFKRVTGDVFYGTMGPKEAQKYRGTILYNSEEDIHFPTLTVFQTLKFAIANKVPRQYIHNGLKSEYIKDWLTATLKALGIQHTKNTVVGDEVIRGVSGGERKRVSLGEVIAAQGSIVCWDNSTRGLDASTAVDFVRSLRAIADTSQVTSITTLYQAGNGILELFDKVLVLDSGRQIYYGPRSLAKEYFEGLGFVCPRGANIADFFTSLTTVHERIVKPGHEDSAPTTAEEFEKIYFESEIARQMEKEIIAVQSFADLTSRLKKAVEAEQPKRKTPLQGPYTVGLAGQIYACLIRQIQIYFGDKASLAMTQTSAAVQALITGSLFYNLSDTSSSIFTRPGAVFFPLLFFNLQSLSEVNASFMGREILAKQRDFGLYRPISFTIACMLADIPRALMQVSIFSIIYYFMVDFQMDVGKFFTFWLLLIISLLDFVSVYRLIGSLFKKFDNAAMASGFASMIMMIYVGFMIPFQKMHVWFRWIFWIDPAGYAYEALMANEYGGLTLDCVGSTLVPNGDGYTSQINKACAASGATADGRKILGPDYLQQEFDYSTHHLWRNVGILCAFWVFYTAITAISLELHRGGNEKSSALVYKRSNTTTKALLSTYDEEGAGADKTVQGSDISSMEDEKQGSKLMQNEAIFTWEHLDYTVSVMGGHRKLLDDVMGWVKPGQLGALMGSSGAGKTTLLDVLAQRKDVGVLEGSILVDGRPLPKSFQRSTGYCEQMDVHESTATVREALEFSARLRQPSSTPEKEKMEYIDTIVDLLELQDIQNAIIGTPGTGLSVEQRKRLTIGVELAAKPSILLFLDEPTSGLDGQSAFNVVRFLRRLTAAGQAILCTIHQPSAALFEAFDSLLLLSKGGKTTYFGETGKDSAIVLDYFARNGAPCGGNVNPAEHIVDVVSGQSGNGVDWNKIWLESPEYHAVVSELARLKEEALSKPSTVISDGSDFATSLSTQLRLLIHRQQVVIWRSPSYTWMKLILHVVQALFSGFTFWSIGTHVFDLKLRLYAVFNFLFIAPGMMNQMQPFFLHARSIFETRERKSKTYKWQAFIIAQVVAELPYLLLCGTVYFCCWYFTCGFPVKSSTSGQIYITMLFYEFLYTAIGQAIAAVSPNEFFASLLNPVVMGAFLINFAGIFVPYESLSAFWKYWMYYLDPFNYLVGGLLTQLLYDAEVTCAADEFITITPPANQTCAEYMSSYLKTGTGYVVADNNTCQYCQYSSGAEYAQGFNYNSRSYGWRDTGITALFCVSTYGFVCLMMMVRSHQSKKALAH